ncbi:hypothetical protein B0H19DRAFT_1385229 [Mycena capillaripes]|nr:hypothetical protein B0H19DRAFT_1385229 [Mycena capillaripes]
MAPWLPGFPCDSRPHVIRASCSFPPTNFPIYSRPPTSSHPANPLLQLSTLLLLSSAYVWVPFPSCVAASAPSYHIVGYGVLYLDCVSATPFFDPGSHSTSPRGQRLTPPRRFRSFSSMSFLGAATPPAVYPTSCLLLLHVPRSLSNPLLPISWYSFVDPSPPQCPPYEFFTKN